MATVSIISIAVNPRSRLEDGAKGERFPQRSARKLECVDKGIAIPWCMLHRGKTREIAHSCLPQEACRPKKGTKASQYGRPGSLLGRKGQFVSDLRPRAPAGIERKIPHLSWLVSRGAPDSVPRGFCVTIASARVPRGEMTAILRQRTGRCAIFALGFLRPSETSMNINIAGDRAVPRLQSIATVSYRTLAKEYSVKNICAPLLLSITMLALAAAVAQAADRVQAGQWEMTIGDGAQGTPTKRCVTAAHANLVNGDDRTFRESLVKAAEEVGCTVKDVKVSGNQVILNTVCGGEENMNTTTYHGDWYEQVNSNGIRVSAKRIGACP
jgi:hypothetical protein